MLRSGAFFKHRKKGPGEASAADSVQIRKNSQRWFTLDAAVIAPCFSHRCAFLG